MPNSLSELHILHAWEDNPIYLKTVQGESGIKIAKFQLVDDNGAINITGNTGVTFMGTKADGSACTVNCTVEDATTGKIYLSSSTNFTSVCGRVVGNIVVSFSDNQNIQFDGITIKVRPNKAIEALIQDDVFATFLNALSRLQDIENGELTAIDTALSTSSTNPVQNVAVATAINTIISRLDGGEFVKVVDNVAADNCNQANVLYKLYITSSSHPSWTQAGGYHYAICAVSTNQITQYVLAQSGGILFRTAPATSGMQSGAWGNFKEVAIKGTSLADYGIANAYTKSETYTKSEVNTLINNLTGTVAQNKTSVENRVTTLEGTVSTHNRDINTLKGQTEFQSNAISSNTQNILKKMAKEFLSVTSFMCDEDGTIFTATDDTVLTNQSFENQDMTTRPYFIWIAHTVTEVENNAFVNTGKIAKIYCENTSDNTPLPSNYQSLPVEYGYNALFMFYLMRSVVTLLNDKADKSNTYSAESADNTFEKKSNKSDNFSFDKTPTTEERQLYPTVARLKELLFGKFYDTNEVDNLLATISQIVATKANATDVYTKTKINTFNNAFENRFELKNTVGFDENGIPVFISDNNPFSAGSCTVNNIKTLFIASNVRLLQSGAFTTNSTGIEVVFIDNEQSGITIQSGALPDGVTIYYKGQFNALGFVIAALKNLSTSKLDDANNSVKTNHIANFNVTEGKLSSELQAKINRTTGVYSYTIPASNWSNNAQSLNLSSVYTVTSKTKVDIEGDDTVLEQLVIDDCDGIYVENNSGSLTIKAITNAPTESITVQLVVYEVEDLN